MSKEQWGHGYWQGVRDARADMVDEPINIEALSKFLVCQMCIINYKREDNSVMTVRDAIIYFCNFGGLSENTMHRIYIYILQKSPLGCYVSGDDGEKWTEDSFILPIWDRPIHQWHDLARDIYEEAHE